jgi:ornithine cyclodeaminase/alanine dehydrogenase
MTQVQHVPYFSGAALDALPISTADVIESIEQLIIARADSTAWAAPKAVILLPDGRYMMAALAAADQPPYLAVKTVLLNPRNSDRGLPQINGLVTMLDSETGVPLAILDGNWITAVRTAGLSMVAAKHMANPTSSVVAFVGTGVQAHSHLNAFADMFPLTGIRVFGRGRKNIDALCARAEEMGLESTICDSGDEAISEADLIVTSITYSVDVPPFLDAGKLKPGSFAAVTDLAAPWRKETFPALDRIFIDDLAQEAQLPNKLAPPDLIDGELSSLVVGDTVGRTAASDRTAFIFRGHAIGDLALSALAYQRATSG